MRYVFAVTRYQLAVLLARRRLWLAPPVLLLAAWLVTDTWIIRIRADKAAQANAWDLPLYVFSSINYLAFALGLGFLILTGDLLPNLVARGSAAVTAVRARGRLRWWTGTVVAAAIASLLFTATAMLCTVLVGMIRLPLTSQASLPTTAHWVRGLQPAPPVSALPRPLLFIIVIALTATVLWALLLTCHVLTIFRPHPLWALLPALFWVTASRFFSGSLLATSGLATFNPLGYLNYALFADVWDSGALIIHGRPLTLGVAIIAGSIALLTILGG